LVTCLVLISAKIVIWAIHRYNPPAPAPFANGKTSQLLPEDGDAEHQYRLGISYAQGRGVHRDYAEAFRWFSKAADQGYAKAEYNLASMYAQGQGVRQDYKEALRWSRLAADQGDAKAEASLGISYARGEGVPQDYAEAVRWYRKAADQGNPVAQYGLGFMYYSGHGVARDYAEALRWYRRAADHGDAMAQYALGFMYSRGEGLPQDYVEAVRWYGKAADAGNLSARDALHSMLCADAFVQLRRWTSIVALLLAIAILVVPQRRWGRATWVSWAMSSAVFALGVIHQLRLSPLSLALLSTVGPLKVLWQGHGPTVLNTVLAASSACLALIAIRVSISQLNRGCDEGATSDAPVRMAS
jgi:hypothetical protein